MRPSVLAAVALVGTVLGGCEHLLKKNPNWSDQVTASPDAWVFELGHHTLAGDAIINMRPDGLSFSQPFRGMEIEAVDPQLAAPGPDSREMSGGKTYRIVRIDCDPAWTFCERFKTSTTVTVTPVRIAQTPLIGAPGYRSVAAREFDSVFVSVTGGRVGYSAGLERQPLGVR